jgi:hypothetical protein
MRNGKRANPSRSNRSKLSANDATSEFSDDFDRKIRDVVQVEGGIIAFSLLALGLVLNAISTSWVLFH